jgi:sugar phosphate permease
MKNRAKPKKKRWLMVVNCSLLFMMAMLFRASTVIISPDLIDDLHLSMENLGLLGSVFFYAFAAAQLPMGLLLDKFGSRRVLICMNLVGVLGALLFARSQGLSGSLLARILLGLGMSVNMMGSLKLYTVWFKPHQFATITGITISIASLGGLLATSPFRLLVDEIGWRNGFMVLAAINFLLVICFYFCVHDAPGDESISPVVHVEKQGISQWQGLLKLFGNLNFWIIALTMGLRDGVFTAIQALWAGPYLIFHLGLPTLKAGNLLLFLNIGAIVGAPIGGLLADRVLGSPRRTGLISLCFLAFSILLLVLWPGPVHLLVLALVLFMLGFFAPFASLLFAHIKTMIPPEMTGVSFTGINLFSAIGGGIFLHALGHVLGHDPSADVMSGGDFQRGFSVCFIAILIALVLYWFSREPKLAVTTTKET